MPDGKSAHHIPAPENNPIRTVHPLLEGLNDVQQEAVLHFEGPLLIFAGAGSGKTRVLTHRIAYLIAERGVAPWNIFAVTFTNKAAKEMKERLEKLVSDRRSKAIWAGTFHSSCARILREFGDRISIPRSFLIFDDSDQLHIVRDCLRDLNIDEKDKPPRAFLTHISKAKEQMISPAEWSAIGGGDFFRRFREVYTLYQEKLKQNSALDFDDLLSETVRLLQNCPDVLEILQERFHFLLVDEYQDVNFAQYRLLYLLARKRQNICVVGDDDQSIYLFRGADVELILKFEHDYPNARILKLEQNYRSTQNILEAAYSVVRHNKTRKDKKLWTENPDGGLLLLHEAANEQEEAHWLLQKILDEVRYKGRKLSDFAILYRTNAQSRALEDMFRNFVTPYKIVGGMRFYERKEVKDVLAYLRLVHTPWDSVSLKRIINIPSRSIGTTTVKVIEDIARDRGISLWETLQEIDSIPGLVPRARIKLKDFIHIIEKLQQEKDHLSVTEMLEHILAATGYLEALESDKSVDARSRVENVREMFTVTREFEKQTEVPTLTTFLEQISLVADIDSLDEDAEAVTMMTLHSSKGLEFPVVIMVGMEQGLFPHVRSLDKPLEMEEERRLCYVGITRAKEELILTYASRRTLFGMLTHNTPSKFLKYIPDELFGSISGNSSRKPKRALSSFDPDENEGAEQYKWAENQKELTGAVPPSGSSPFAVGDKVKHPVFGRGVVISTTGVGSNAAANIAFPTLGIKNILLDYAKLEKLP